jgi:Lysophospholipase L1 and related esterases
MFLKGVFVTTALFLSVCGIAQTKIISLYTDQTKNATLTFYPPDPLASPTGTSIVICGSADTDSSIIAALTKKGCVAFQLKNPQSAITREDVAKAFEYLQNKVGAYQIIANKIGLLTLNVAGSLITDLNSAAFIGIIDPGTLSQIKVSTTTPLLIDAENEKNKEVFSFYNSWSKRGGKADIHLHQQSVNDSVKISEVINWMASLGFMKSISNEKTEAQKKSEDWANLKKYYDDLFHKDWAWLTRFEADNEKVSAPALGEKRVVFLGNSITEGWIKNDPDFFKNNNYINRGIGGQTTPQMLVRFREDVVNLHPQVVVILAGINDIAENTGPSKLENVAGNIISMSEIAMVNGIKVILCSVLPALSFPWHPGIKPTESILRLNAMLKEYAGSNKLGYIDYYSAVVDENQGFKKGLVTDGVHPNLAGYKIMEPLVKAAIDEALSSR